MSRTFTLQGFTVQFFQRRIVQLDEAGRARLLNVLDPGIMHFDPGCNCTQGILLVDYLKSILTGQNLPPDVDQESQSSVFYKQYDPTQPSWVHNANLLRSTDLTNAFTPE